MKSPGTKKGGRKRRKHQRDDRSKATAVFESIGGRVGISLFLLACLVRGVYLYDNRDNPTFDVPIVDSMTYDQMARKAVEGQGIAADFFWQQFFYPSFLYVVYLFSNSSVIWVKIIQLFVGAVTCVLTYKVGERVFGRTAGFLAGCIAALYGPLIFFGGELLAACWGAFWAAALLALLLKTAEKPNAVLCCLLGLCGAVSIITRPNFLPFFAAGYIWLVVVWIRQRVGARVLLNVVCSVVGFLTVALPVAIKNYSLTGRSTFLPATGAVNLYIGNNPDFEAVSIRPGLKWKSIVDLPSKHGAQTFGQTQEFYTSKVLEYIRAEPISFVRGIGRKSLEFFSSREVPGNIDVYLLSEWSEFVSLLMWKAGGFGFPFGVLLPLAILGLVLNRRCVPVPVMLLVVLYPATVILTHIEARYRIPVIIPMCILAGSALAAIGRRYREKRWRSLLTAGICGAIIAFLISIPGPFCGERIDYEPELYFALADSLNKRGRADESIGAYSKAIALKNDYVEAHHNLGLVLVDRGRIREGIEHYRAALKICPEFASVHNDLGRAFCLLGENEKALEHHHKAIEIDPKNADAYNDLGNVLSKMGRFEDAIKSYSKALDLAPNDASLYSNLGNVLAMSGRLTEAIGHYERSLAMRPGNAKTLSNLGNALLGLGRLREAEEKYTESLGTASDNAGTHFNLGGCLEKQGRLDEAVEEYGRALAVDPGHKGARDALERHRKPQ
jgi:tetratricopeptide (TPR) repeat protein